MKGIHAPIVLVMTVLISSPAFSDRGMELPPLDPFKTDPIIIDESRWNEGGDVIVERTFEFFDGERTTYPKHRYKKISETELELIWRSEEAKILDRRMCRFNDSEPMGDGDRLIIGTGTDGYPSGCHKIESTPIPGASRDQSSSDLGMTPRAVAGNQKYFFDNASTSVEAGTRRAVAKAVARYENVNGGGNIWVAFQSKAGIGACASRNDFYAPSGSAHTGALQAWTRCTVTDTPGAYLFRVQGCAVSSFLCESRDYVTTVY